MSQQPTTPMPPQMPQPTPQQPAPQPHTPAASYPGYPYPYAGYPAYGYPYYPGYYQFYQAPMPPRSPSERPSQPGAARLRNTVLAVIAAVLTVAAIVAAAATAAIGQSAPAPASGGLQLVYNQQLTDDAGNWVVDQGCVFQDGALFADGESRGAVCEFVPSTKIDLLSQGFQLSVTMAPGEAVAAEEVGAIILGESTGRYVVAFSQEGDYALTYGRATTLVNGSTIAWHADPSLPNTITLRYSSANNQLDVYANGQHVFAQSVTLGSGAPVSLAAPEGAQAIFTSFSLYGANAAS